MKTKFLLVTATLAATALVNTAQADIALSPRAQANQIRVVPAGGDLDLTRVALGAAARAKSSGDHSVAITGGAKDQDLVRGLNSLGVAAKSKATGVSGAASNFQVAPLK